MSEKQIEEIGMSGYSKFAWKLWSELKLPMTQCLAIEKIIQEQGYRKQTEGEWVNNHCSVCGMTTLGEEVWKHLGLTPPKFEYCMDFCPTCGAKMKGAEQ